MENNTSNDNVSLILPARREYVSTARLTASSIANRLGFNIDEVEDIKVAVSEVCNILLAKETDETIRYRINFAINGNMLTITFEGENAPLNCMKDSFENEYGLYIMQALMDSVELCSDSKSIVMTKKIGE